MSILRILLVIQVVLTSLMGHGQSNIQLFGGYQRTYTSVAEYTHPTRTYYRIDSVSLTPHLNAPVFGVATEFEMAQNFYLNTGLTFSKKGIQYINYSTFAGQYFESWVGTQEYFGVQILLKYHRRIGNSAFGYYVSTGCRIDFPYGEPTNAALANGPGAEYIAPFGRFSKTELVWINSLGGSYGIGPGDLFIQFSFLAGITNPIEDDYIYARTRSFGLTMGYAIHLKSK